jgi:hypothetical protein
MTYIKIPQFYRDQPVIWIRENHIPLSRRMAKCSDLYIFGTKACAEMGAAYSPVLVISDWVNPISRADGANPPASKPNQPGTRAIFNSCLIVYFLAFYFFTLL